MSNEKWQVGVEYVRNAVLTDDIIFAEPTKKLYKFFNKSKKFTVTKIDGARVVQVVIDGKTYYGDFFCDSWACIFTSNELKYFDVVGVEKMDETPPVKVKRKSSRTKFEKFFDLAFALNRENLIELPDIRRFSSIDDYLSNVKEQITNRKESMITKTAELATVIEKIEKVLN